MIIEAHLCESSCVIYARGKSRFIREWYLIKVLQSTSWGPPCLSAMNSTERTPFSEASQAIPQHYRSSKVSLTCSQHPDIDSTNVVVEWLTLLRIREFPGSNLVTESGSTDRGFSWFSSYPPGEWWNSTLKWGHGRFLLNPFHLIIHISFIWRCTVWVTEKASLNKLQI
jgi:hypothetical protein